MNIRDYPKAMDWFLKAQQQQNAYAFVNIGVMHRDGNGVTTLEQKVSVTKCKFLYFTLEIEDGFTLVYPLTQLDPYPWSINLVLQSLNEVPARNSGRLQPRCGRMNDGGGFVTGRLGLG